MSPQSENHRTGFGSEQNPEPNFFIVGAPRCGTTALSTYLSEHHAICFSEPKEPHFFCTDMPGMRYIRDEQAYLACFREKSDKAHSAVGEGSVWYLYSPEAIRNILIRYPRSKFIAMIRNPLEMVPSFHQKAIESLDESETDFEKAWLLQASRRQGQHIPARCRDARLLDYAWVGKLGAQLQRLFSEIEQERRMIILFDDFAENPAQEYRRVLEFLQVDDDGRTNFPAVNSNRTVRSQYLMDFATHPPAGMVRLAAIGRRLARVKRLGILPRLRHHLLSDVQRPRLSENQRGLLVDEFTNDIELLSSLIERDLKHWTR